MGDVVFKEISTTDDLYAQVFNLREEILRKPIGLSLHDEDLSNEVNDHIMVAEKNNEVVGCLILTPKNQNSIQLRQMAVSASLQKQNVGKMLVNYAEEFSWQHGYKKIVLHARMVAKGFYEKLNYTQTSDVFTEVGIPHVIMEKTKQ